MKTAQATTAIKTQTTVVSKDSTAKDMLRDMAFILRMTKQVRDDILSTPPTRVANRTLQSELCPA